MYANANLENTNPPEQTIRTARPDEASLVCDILADAFSNDPVMRWINNHPEIYTTLFRSEALPLYMKHGHVFINKSLSGAAMWVPPGVPSSIPLHWSILPLLWKLFSTGGLGSVRRALKLESIFAKNHISKPHYYLHAIGTAQRAQGRGVGSALLRAGLRHCDKTASLAYLESSNVKNNALYERFGFRVTGQIELPEDGPTIWLMLREPATTANSAQQIVE